MLFLLPLSLLSTSICFDWCSYKHVVIGPVETQWTISRRQLTQLLKRHSLTRSMTETCITTQLTGNECMRLVNVAKSSYAARRSSSRLAAVSAESIILDKRFRQVWRKAGTACVNFAAMGNAKLRVQSMISRVLLFFSPLVLHFQRLSS